MDWHNLHDNQQTWLRLAQMFVDFFLAMRLDAFELHRRFEADRNGGMKASTASTIAGDSIPSNSSIPP
jgi:hypothetical protein